MSVKSIDCLGFLVNSANVVFICIKQGSEICSRGYLRSMLRHILKPGVNMCTFELSTCVDHSAQTFMPGVNSLLYYSYASTSFYPTEAVSSFLFLTSTDSAGYLLCQCTGIVPVPVQQTGLPHYLSVRHRGQGAIPTD